MLLLEGLGFLCGLIVGGDGRVESVIGLGRLRHNCPQHLWIQERLLLREDLLDVAEESESVRLLLETLDLFLSLRIELVKRDLVPRVACFDLLNIEAHFDAEFPCARADGYKVELNVLEDVEERRLLSGVELVEEPSVAVVVVLALSSSSHEPALQQALVSLEPQEVGDDLLDFRLALERQGGRHLWEKLEGGDISG